ncbi:MAG: hypothetical protein ACRCUM_02190 [Mycoplasmoidaceae bacterium]
MGPFGGALIIKGVLWLSIALMIIMGINIPLIIFDLTLKVISFVSGATFFEKMISGIFDPSDPLFIIYITIFLLTLILSVAYTINYSIKRVYNKIDIDANQRGFTKGDFFKRFKFLIFWIVGFFFVPFLVNLLLVGVSSLAGLFGIDVLSPGMYDKFTQEQINNYLGNINIEINKHNQSLIQLKNILETMLANPEINSGGNGIDANEISKQLLNINNAISKLEIFKSAINNIPNMNSSAFDGALEAATKAWNEFIKVGGEINQKLIEEQIQLYNMEFGASGIIDIEVLNDFSFSLKEIDKLVVRGQRITGDGGRYFNISLSNIKTLNSNNVPYISERITIILSQILYPNEKDFLNPFETMGSLGSFLAGPFQMLGRLGAIFTDFFGTLHTIFKTIALTFVLGTFFNIAINFGKRTFQLLGLVITSPYFFISGINDEGKKLTIWFETIIGKILLIVFVSLAIEIWSILILSLLGIPGMVNGVYGEVDGNLGYDTLKLFITCILLSSSTYALGEFINYLSEIFRAQDSFQGRNQTYLRQVRSKVQGAASNIDGGVKQAQSFVSKMKSKSSGGIDVGAPTAGVSVGNTSNQYSNVSIKRTSGSKPINPGVKKGK